MDLCRHIFSPSSVTAAAWLDSGNRTTWFGEGEDHALGSNKLIYFVA